MTITWNDVHAGDKARGGDNADWTVAARTPGPRWVVAGAHDHFTMRNGDRELSITKRLIDPARVTERADHSAMAGAWQALTDGGFRLDLIGESIVTEQDQFGAPAARGKGAEEGIELDRWNRYVLPDPETGEMRAWTRVTTIAKTIADLYNLHQWDLRMVAKGMGIREDLAASAASLDIETEKKKLQAIADQAKEAAGASRGANYGNAFHRFAERYDKGEPLASLGIPEKLRGDVVAYAEELKRGGLSVIPEYSERIVCIPEIGACGTLDRIVRQPTGPTHSAELSVLDLKSGKDLGLSWLEIEMQQACYSRAKYMWDKPTKTWLPMPTVDQHRALIAHSPIGQSVTTIYGVNLIEGWEEVQLAMTVRAKRSRAKGWVVAPQDPKTVLMLQISQAASSEALAKLWAHHNGTTPTGQWTDEVQKAADERFAHLKSVTQ